eukprot:scaffold431_cov334-Pavlova_lutheri.AAC.71
MEAKHVSPIESGARAQQNNSFDSIAHETNAKPLVAMRRQSLLLDIHFRSHACFPLLHFGSTSPTIRIGLPSSMSISSYLRFLLEAMLWRMPPFLKKTYPRAWPTRSPIPLEEKLIVRHDDPCLRGLVASPFDALFRAHRVGFVLYIHGVDLGAVGNRPDM